MTEIRSYRVSQALTVFGAGCQGDTLNFICSAANEFSPSATLSGIFSPVRETTNSAPGTFNKDSTVFSEQFYKHFQLFIMRFLISVCGVVT